MCTHLNINCMHMHMIDIDIRARGKLNVRTYVYRYYRGTCACMYNINYYTNIYRRAAARAPAILNANYN
jgi:hypothetical protein